MTSLHELPRTSKRAYRRVGRGQSSTRGKTSGRGGKGQTARAGHKMRPEFRDIIKKLPKRRGHGKNRARTVNAEQKRAIAIPVEALEELFENGAEVTPRILVEKGLIKARGARTPMVKVLGPSAQAGIGTLSKKLSLKGITVSASARIAIEKAGGTIALLDTARPKSPQAAQGK